MKWFHEFFLIKFSRFTWFPFPVIRNLPNCCKRKYDPSISRTFLNLIFGGNLKLGPTVRHPDFYNWIFHAWLGLPSYRSTQGALRSREAYPGEKIRRANRGPEGVKTRRILLPHSYKLCTCLWPHFTCSPGPSAKNRRGRTTKFKRLHQLIAQLFIRKSDAEFSVWKSLKLSHLYRISQQVLLKISEFWIFCQDKKYLVKLKGDLQCLAKM